GRAGHQVVVCTSNTMALDRWRAAGQSVIDWQQHARLVDETLVRERVVKAPEVTRVAVSTSAPEVDETFTLLADDPIERVPVLGSESATLRGRIGIRTVGDLVEAEPERVARGLELDHVTSLVVELWQSHARLLMFVPHLTL